MIFDDYDNLSGNQVTVTPNSQQEREPITSLDNFMADRDERIRKCDYAHFYDLYQIHINKTFMAGPYALKRSKNVLGKRQSIINSGIKKKRRTGNYLLLLTDKKEKNVAENESGIEEGALSIENVQGELASLHSDSSSISERDIGSLASSSNEDDKTLENEASIHQKTQICKNQQLIGVNKGHFYSLNWSLQAIRGCLSLKRSKSAGEIKAKARDEDIVQLESFVSLDEIAKKPKPMRAEDENCAICCKEYVLKDFIARLRACNHIFHKACIDGHIKRSSPDRLLCPECRESI